MLGLVMPPVVTPMLVMLVPTQALAMLLVVTPMLVLAMPAPALTQALMMVLQPVEILKHL